MIDLTSDVLVERVTNINDQYFFGYYDMSPESPDGTKVLVNKPRFIDHMPMVDDELEIGYIDLTAKSFNKIAETHAWNFQEGCRLQWLSDDFILFNDRGHTDGKSIKSYKYCVSSKKIVDEYSLPIYSVSIKRQIALSYNFFNNRYNYAHASEEEKTDEKKDGIFLLDLKNGETKLVCSLDKLMKLANSYNTKNWVEHCVLSPEGDKFFFFHRWNLANGGFATKFFVGDFKGNIECLLDNAFCSHSGWRGNNQISAWGRLPSKVNSVQNTSQIRESKFYKVALRIYHRFVKSQAIRQKITNDSYIMFDLEKHSAKKISNMDIIQDGHCTWDNTGRFMLTDTYADNEKLRNLLILDYQTNQLYRLGRFYTYPFKNPLLEKEWTEPGIQCDLHPKWSFSQNHVYFDSVYEGKRQLYRVDVRKIMNDIIKNS